MPEYLSNWNLVTFLFLAVCVALTISAHKKAWYASCSIVAINFAAGHFLYGGLSWLSLLNLACLAAMLITNRLIASKWYAACSILVYSVAIDTLMFLSGMALGSADLSSYVWAGISFNLPKLYFTLPIALVWQFAERKNWLLQYGREGCRMKAIAASGPCGG